MHEYMVEFSGYCVVKAEDAKQAEVTFIKNIYSPVDSPISYEWYDVNKISYVEPLAHQLSMFDEL